jgi:large repetitive protein
MRMDQRGCVKSRKTSRRLLTFDAMERRELLAAVVDLNPTALATGIGVQVAFTRTIATFTADGKDAKSTDFTATIAWGDGEVSTGLVTEAPGENTFTVTGTHTYATVDMFTATVQVAGDTGGAKVGEVPVTVGVVAIPQSAPIVGILTTADGSTTSVTNVNRPSFEGSTVPFSIVQVFGQKDDSKPTVNRLLGQAVADASGRWSVGSVTLHDGSYIITASTTAPGELPSPPVRILTDELVIDTIAPRVRAANFNAKDNQITLVIQDTGSGFDPSVLENDELYVVTGPAGLTASGPKGIKGISAAVSGFYSNARAVTLDLGERTPKPGSKFKAASGLYRLQVMAAGLTDRAGNPLDGEFVGSFPSGNGWPGGNFLARFFVATRTPTAKLKRFGRR